MDARVPPDAAATIAYGDLASSIAALVALVALQVRLRGALALVWVFSILGTADLALGTLTGVRAELYKFHLGWNWYILNYYVPMLIVSQVMIFHRLLYGPGPLRVRRQP